MMIHLPLGMIQCKKNNPLAPHNNPIRRDNPFEPWNMPTGSERDLSNNDKKAYGLRSADYNESDY